jgi:predicted lipoprotein with Yx(FWY)xxD motif
MTRGKTITSFTAPALPAVASLVATTTRSDGGSAVTYNGRPVDRFAGDHKPGDTNGQGLTAFLGAWLALSPACGEISSGSGGNSGY